MGLECREIRQIGGAGEEAEHAGARRLRIESAGQAEPENLREIVVEPHRRAQHGGVGGSEQAELGGLFQDARRRGIENVGHRRGVHELQILGDELDIDECAGRVFEVPGIGVALLRGDRGAHLDHVLGDGALVALAAEHVADRGRRARGESRRSADDARARQCHVLPSPGLAFLVTDEAFDLGRQRTGAAGRPQPHVDRIEHAVIGLHGQRADQALGEPREVLRAVERTLTVGLRMCGVEIVDDNEVEVGRRRHLPRAEPAERHDRRLLAADVAVPGNEVFVDAGIERAGEHFGEAGVDLARLLGRDRPGQDSRPDQEHALLAELADRIEHVLVATGLAERLRQLRRQPLLVRHRAEEARVDERVDDVGVVRQDIGEAGRNADDQGDETDEVRILPQQREEAPASAQPGEEAVEGGKCRIGILHASELVDDDRHQRVEIFPRLLPPQRAVEGGVPAMRRRRHRARLPEAHFREAVQRLALTLRR